MYSTSGFVMQVPQGQTRKAMALNCLCLEETANERPVPGEEVGTARARGEAFRVLRRRGFPTHR